MGYPMSIGGLCGFTLLLLTRGEAYESPGRTRRYYIRILHLSEFLMFRMFFLSGSLLDSLCVNH